MLIQSKLIAIDFDGTIVHDAFPEIGREVPFAFDTLRLLQGDGHRLILWTVRKGSRLVEAVEFCRKNGVEFYAVNQNFDGEELGNSSRKLNVDIFVDDRNVGGFPGWGEVYQMISQHEFPVKRKKRLFGFRR